MHYDTIISGGGINGILAAVGLRDRGLSVAVVDQSGDLLSQSRKRVFALSKKSQCILKNLNLWQEIEMKAQPILEILIKDMSNSSVVNYNNRLVDQDAMGYVIDSSALCDALKRRLNHIKIYSNTSYKNFSLLNYGVELELVNGVYLNAPVLICAEGKNSTLRNLISIPCVKYDYNQKSILFNVIHQNAHHGIAREYFFPGGPFAVLPMINQFESCIIWTEKSSMCDILISLSEQDFLNELQSRCYPHLQKINLSSERKCYNLSLLVTESLNSKRVIFIGDSYHTIHPIAGQGLNLGIKDAYSAINILSSSKEGGLDLGSSYVINKFSKERYSDNLLMTLITHTTNQIFSNNSKILKIIRGIGLNIVEQSPQIKKYFINHAMGFNNLLSI